MGISPSFINEMTPDKMTGQVGTLIQQAGNTAFITSYILGLSMPISDLESNPYNYLWMVMIIFPSILCLYQIYFLTKVFPYESPAWLLANSFHDKALETFSYVYYPEYSYKGIERLIPPETFSDNDRLINVYNSTYKDVLCKRKFRKMLRISLVLNIGQQTSGSMMMRIYATKIFEDIGGGKRFAQIFTVIAGAVSLTGSISTIFLLKKFGRKKLLIIGQIGMSLIFLSLALLEDYTQFSPEVKAMFIFIYFGFLSISLGPTFWAYIGEVCNDKCIGIGFSLNLISVMILSFVYPIAQANLGVSFCFYGLSLMCFCLLIYEIIEIFETKGLSKQEIQLKVLLLSTNE
ncbi:hypothetical protein SteCoe_25355 [Stentor coeruleus]|uniref:Major facilitator superfamily (MFS) profile domain-containing protein n=1 Tax=Stentor coeruleus TaxID=5963 RepID=A0A1R2BFK5_9CILI|nr:hypothetical protein SteCoe_25355 [Stentor coeruleus]